MPGAGMLGGPGLPGRVRISDSQLTSSAVMEQDNFGRFIREAERSGDRLLEMLGERMEDRAQRYAPVRTRRLKNSIQYYVLPGGREVRVSSDVPYAGVMESGSRPHLIHGVRANFRFKGGQRFVWNNYKFGPIDPAHPSARYQNWTPDYGATVRHPGTKGHFFFKRAFNETFSEARAVMRLAYSR